MLLGDSKIRFANEIKNLGIFFKSKLRDDEDINRQVRYLYRTANRLKICLPHFSTEIKYVLFRTYCSSTYAYQLWENFKKNTYGPHNSF